MVATEGVAEDQLPPVTEEVKVEEPLAQIAVVPEIVPAEGAAVTVTVAVVVAAAVLLQLGVAVGTLVVNLLELKSAVVDPLKPTCGVYVVVVFTVEKLLYTITI